MFETVSLLMSLIDRSESSQLYIMTCSNESRVRRASEDVRVTRLTTHGDRGSFRNVDEEGFERLLGQRASEVAGRDDHGEVGSLLGGLAGQLDRLSRARRARSDDQRHFRQLGIGVERLSCRFDDFVALRVRQLDGFAHRAEADDADAGGSDEFDMALVRLEIEVLLFVVGEEGRQGRVDTMRDVVAEF